MSIAQAIPAVNPSPDGGGTVDLSGLSGLSPDSDLSEIVYTNPAGIAFRVVYAEAEATGAISAYLLDAFGQIHGTHAIIRQIRILQGQKDAATNAAARDSYADAIRWRRTAVGCLLATEAEIARRRADGRPEPGSGAVALESVYERTARQAAAAADRAAANGTAVVTADQALANRAQRIQEDQEADRLAAAALRHYRYYQADAPHRNDSETGGTNALWLEAVDLAVRGFRLATDYRGDLRIGPYAAAALCLPVHAALFACRTADDYRDLYRRAVSLRDAGGPSAAVYAGICADERGRLAAVLAAAEARDGN
jgi:hypothetical protein